MLKKVKQKEIFSKFRGENLVSFRIAQYWIDTFIETLRLKRKFVIFSNLM